MPSYRIAEWMSTPPLVVPPTLLQLLIVEMIDAQALDASRELVSCQH